MTRLRYASILLIAGAACWTPAAPRVNGAGAAGWTIAAGLSGGIAGASTLVTATSAGQLIVEGSQRKGRCTAELTPADREALEKAVVQAKAEAWRPKYVSPLNPNGCCDLYQFSLRLQREDADGRTSARASTWNADSGDLVPADAKSLFKAVFALEKTCQ